MKFETWIYDSWFEGIVLNVNCNGMYRYYIGHYFTNIELTARCSKTYTETSDDDFEDFFEDDDFPEMNEEKKVKEEPAEEEAEEAETEE